MPTMPPPEEARATYTRVAIDQGMDDLAARSTVFGFFRAYYKWSLRGSNAQRVFLIATGFAADKLPTLRPFLIPFAIIQAFFVVISWIGPPIIDVFLCLDGQTRRLIPPWRRKGALLTGTFLVSAMALAVVAYATGDMALGLSAFCVGAMIFPATAVYRLPAGGPRALQAVALILFVGLAWMAYVMFDDDAGKVFAMICALGSIASARLAAGPIARNPLNRR
jgi:hypothetical protein